MAERYEPVEDFGCSNFGVGRLVKDKKTNELFAVKYIERGYEIDEKVQREIFSYRSLRHPNIVLFKEVFVTPTHLAIVMEYASGGDLFNRIRSAGQFSEDEVKKQVLYSLRTFQARILFQQLISGVSYCHSMEIFNRDLILENALLDGSPTPRLKICDFGHCQSGILHSQPKGPKRAVVTPVYIAPEVLLQKEYDGKIADVWSCGVTLYVMLFGTCPFQEPEDPRNLRKTIGRILGVQYFVPDNVRVSADCQHLLSRIFVADPSKRITISEIKQHPWFLENLQTSHAKSDGEQPVQSEEDILRIIEEAKTPGEATTSRSRVFGW